jgi:hypothetical protein
MHDYIMKDSMYEHGSAGQEAFFQDLCEKIFGLDGNVRFVGLASKEGHILGIKYPRRKKVTMTDIDIEKGLLPQVLQVELYHRVSKVAGRLRYHVGTFENLYAASVPIAFNPKERLFIIMSFDLGCDPVRIIEDKLLPLIQSNKEYLV